MSHYEEFAKNNHGPLQRERLKIEVAALIYQRMKAAGVSRKVLAEKLGVTKGRISQILCGERNLTLDTVADIFTALNDRAVFSSDRAAQQTQFQLMDDVKSVMLPPPKARMQFCAALDDVWNMQELRIAS